MQADTQEQSVKYCGRNIGILNLVAVQAQDPPKLLRILGQPRAVVAMGNWGYGLPREIIQPVFAALSAACSNVGCSVAVAVLGPDDYVKALRNTGDMISNTISHSFSSLPLRLTNPKGIQLVFQSKLPHVVPSMKMDLSSSVFFHLDDEMETEARYQTGNSALAAVEIAGKWSHIGTRDPQFATWPLSPLEAPIATCFVHFEPTLPHLITDTLTALLGLVELTSSEKQHNIVATGALMRHPSNLVDVPDSIRLALDRAFVAPQNSPTAPEEEEDKWEVDSDAYERSSDNLSQDGGEAVGPKASLSPTPMGGVPSWLLEEGGIAEAGESEIALSASDRPRGAPKGSSVYRLSSLMASTASKQEALLLWVNFVQRLRSHWEELKPIPGLSTVLEENRPVLSDCLIQQKLNVIQFCILDVISSENGMERGFQSMGQTVADYSQEESLPGSVALDGDYVVEEEESDDEDEDEDDDQFEDAAETLGDETPRVGALHPFEAANLECGCPLLVPMTLPAAPMSEDVVSLQLDVLARLGHSEEAQKLRARLQAGPLMSDMSAFKAANPGSVLSDFVRWHSPRDWKEGKLSDRMADGTNLWHQVWKKAKPLAAEQQKRLYDPAEYAEAALDTLYNLTIGEVARHLLPVATWSAYDSLPHAGEEERHKLRQAIRQWIGEEDSRPMNNDGSGIDNVEGLRLYGQQVLPALIQAEEVALRKLTVALMLDATVAQQDSTVRASAANFVTDLAAGKRVTIVAGTDDTHYTLLQSVVKYFAATPAQTDRWSVECLAAPLSLGTSDESVMSDETCESLLALADHQHRMYCSFAEGELVVCTSLAESL